MKSTVRLTISNKIKMISVAIQLLDDEHKNVMETHCYKFPSMMSVDMSYSMA